MRWLRIGDDEVVDLDRVAHFVYQRTDGADGQPALTFWYGPGACAVARGLRASLLWSQLRAWAEAHVNDAIGEREA